MVPRVCEFTEILLRFYGAPSMSIYTSPRMARHIRELFMCAGAKIQNRLEKSANNNKEYGQKAKKKLKRKDQ